MIPNTYWTPPQDLINSCALTRFIDSLVPLVGKRFASYEELHAWSIANPHEFWSSALRFLDLKTSGELDPVFDQTAGPTPLAKSWFPKLSLNFADVLLSYPDNDLALIAWSENKLIRRYSFKELRARVLSVANFFEQLGLAAGDRVFGYLPNIPEAVIAMLSSAKLGATWSSCGTDYQIEGVISRIERVKPKVLVVATSYLWRGEQRSLSATIEAIVARVKSIKSVLLVDYLGSNLSSSLEGVSVAKYEELPAAPKVWQSGPLFPFSQPLYIVFSSGTTGTPKGIVHGAGNTLLEHKKEHILHSDIRPGDRVFYQTSASWMMWNWLVSGLASGATVVLYDGDPFCEQGAILWRVAEEEQVSHFGTSAAYLGELRRRAIRPRAILSQSQSSNHGALANLRAILSTGSVLSPELYDYVRDAIKETWLQSISGGTDIVGCFGLGCPIKPVVRGEVQCKSLGYDVRVFNQSGHGVIGEQGELVCVQPAPSMPLYFLDDSDGSSYRNAYFADFPGIWRHGDLVCETSAGGLVFAGRSDTTLKPGGVRIATADIYAALAKVPEVAQALAVGYTPPGAATERIVLFIVLNQGAMFNAKLEQEIKQTLRDVNTFYVPAVVMQAPDLPRTPNNKLSELSVKRILHGEDVLNPSSLANPECLDFFRSEALKRVVADLGM